MKVEALTRLLAEIPDYIDVIIRVEVGGDVRHDHVDVDEVVLASDGVVLVPAESGYPISSLIDEALAARATVEEALAAGRRATLDPGQFVERAKVDGEYERLDQWQARALAAAAEALVAPDRDPDYTLPRSVGGVATVTGLVRTVETIADGYRITLDARESS